MGCDIHIALERRVGDKWVMVDRLSGDATRRNYKRFSALACVRGDGPLPIGIPEDVSDSAALYLSDWEGDAHSHSWMMVAEAAKVFLSTEHEPPAYVVKWPAEHYFMVEEEDIPSHRIVFFFDN